MFAFYGSCFHCYHHPLNASSLSKCYVLSFSIDAILKLTYVHVETYQQCTDGQISKRYLKKVWNLSSFNHNLA